MNDTEVLVARVSAWSRYKIVEPPASCDRCRSTTRKVRDTPAGALCIECWIHLPQCVRYGWGPGLHSWARKVYCASCLNPPMSKEYLREQWENIVARRKPEPPAVVKSAGVWREQGSK